MLHNTHVYFASKLYKSEDNLLIVGSFLPDIAITGIIGWEGGLHGNISKKNFSNFVKNKFPNYVNLYKGVLTHNILDDFTHDGYHGSAGYAYQNNEELSKLVGKYYDVGEKRAREIAHNYIESGVDILLLRKYSNIPERIKNAVELSDKEELSVILSSYFNIDKSKFSNTLLQFFEVLTKYDLTQLSGWSSLWEDLETLLYLKIIGSRKRKKLLLTSIDIVKDTYEDFLHHALKEASKKLG